MSENTTPAPEGASQPDPLAPPGALSVAIDMAALRQLDMKELYDLRDAMHVLGSLACGLLCQPRFNRGNEVNGAGEVLESLLEFVNGYEEAAFNVAVAARPTAKDDVYWRGMTVLRYETRAHPDLNEFAVLAMSVARDAAAALFRRGGAS